MKRLLQFALLFLFSIPLFGQNFRWDNTATTTSGVGQQLPVLALPGTHVSFYACVGGNCSAQAITYQSVTDTVGCPAGLQVVWQPTVSTGCVATADSKGNFGGWFQPGLYQYLLSGNGGNRGPYYFSVGGGGSSGASGVTYVTTAPSGICTAVPPIQVLISTGTAYTCNNGTWAAISGGTGGTPGGANTQVQINESGVFGGDSTFTFNTTTKAVGAKVINGTSYSNAYTGATADVRINACLQDAMTNANGNTSGVCDATAERSQNTAAQITVGDSNNDPVGLLLPCVGYFTGTMTDGTSYVIKQYGSTTIRSVCPSAGIAGRFGFNVTGGSSVAGIMEIVGGGSSPYVYDSGFNVTNISGGHVTTSGIGFLMTGQFADGTTLEGINVYDSLDTYAAEIYGACCETTWHNGSINANYGGTPLYLLTDNANDTTGFTFADGTIVHPGTGLPAVNCTDTRASTVSSVHLRDIYTETGNSGTATPIYQSNGCADMSFSNVSIPNYATVNSPAVQVSNAYNTFVTIDHMWFESGTHAWVYPALAVQNNFTGNKFYSDANGYVAHFSSTTSTSSDVVNPMTSIGDLLYGNSTQGVAARLAGNPAATDEVVVSHGSGTTTASVTTKTCANITSSGNVTTCTWSTAPAIGESVFIGVQNYGTSAQPVVTDSAGNIYNPVGNGPHLSTTVANLHTQLFYFGPLTASITTTTVTGGTTGLSLEGNTATGVAANSLDGPPCIADTTGTTSITCNSALTTTIVNDYIFCDARNATGGDTFTVGSGFTAGSAANSNSQAQYKVQSSIGALTPSITASGTNPASMTCAAFVPAIANPITLSNAPAISLINATNTPAITQLNGDVVAGPASGNAASTVKSIGGGTIFTSQPSGPECNTIGTGAFGLCTNLQVTGNSQVGTYSLSGVYNVPCTTTPVFDLSHGDVQILTLTTACGTVTSSSVTNQPASGFSQRVTFIIIQDSTGGHVFPNPAWASGWAPVQLTANGATSQMLTATSTGLFADDYNAAFCAVSGTSPLACGNAYKGYITVAAGTNPTATITTTALGAQSIVDLHYTTAIGPAVTPTVTCNTTVPTADPYWTGGTVGTNFTVTVPGTFTTNPVCLTYIVINP